MTLLAFTLRKKILLFGLLLLLLPNIAYVYLSSTAAYLLDGQKQALANTANTLASFLHEKPMLFVNSSQLNWLDMQAPLSLSNLQSAIRLDGRLEDWGTQPADWQLFDGNALIEQAMVYRPESLQFRHGLGQYQEFVYAAFDVQDDSLLFRPLSSLRVDRNDFLLLAMSNGQGAIKRYIVAPYEPGWVNAYLLDDSAQTYTPISLETQIQGQWRITPNGYVIELRLPQTMVEQGLSFAIGDVDDEDSRALNYLMGTAMPNGGKDLSPILGSYHELNTLLDSLSYLNARVWILDNQKRVLAVKGDLQSAYLLGQDSPQQGWIATIHQWLLPIYREVLGQLQNSVEDEWAQSVRLEGAVIDMALNGIQSISSRPSGTASSEILVSAQPVLVNDEVIALVVAEQSTLQTQLIVREALEYQLTVTLVCIVIGSVLLVLFANRIANRIRDLRNETESAIDSTGKIINNIAPSSSADEIGDLSRAFHHVLARLTQYNQYLENMASRLSHELRTPVAIVNSSLDNLELDKANAETFISRARQGINRLSRILQNMSEATRLEEIIKSNDIEVFDVGALLSSCIEGYRMSHSEYRFELDINIQNVRLSGSADLFVQMLDKIISNAVEFSQATTPIRIRAFEKQQKTCISITNMGPLLPENMRNQLLNSMVSVREASSTSSSHLGLGLFIANMIANYHKGSLEIDNLPDHSGVIVLLSFNKVKGGD